MPAGKIASNKTRTNITIEKELKSKSPDIKRLDRLNAILKNIQGTLAKCKDALFATRLQYLNAIGL